MRKGHFWLRVSLLVAIAGGFVAERSVRAAGVLPEGWGWSMASYAVGALLTFVVFAVVLTKTGR